MSAQQLAARGRAVPAAEPISAERQSLLRLLHALTEAMEEAELGSLSDLPSYAVLRRKRRQLARLLRRWAGMERRLRRGGREHDGA